MKSIQKENDLNNQLGTILETSASVLTQGTSGWRNEGLINHRW